LAREEPLSDYLVIALVCAEDHRFFQHAGVDLFAVLRAISRTLVGFRQGGSTIEQQLARTISGDRSQSVKRKLHDWIVAAHLSERFQKEQLAIAYLRLGYFGNSVAGAFEASKRLGFSPSQLSLSAACATVALLKRPLGRAPSPKKRSTFALRRAWIESRIHFFVSPKIR
jgi:penicillin-binding protein 1A